MVHILKTARPLLSGYALLAGWLLLLLFSSVLAPPKATADDIKVITDINAWNHPVKKVFQKHEVVLKKVELHNQTYPVFYVELPYDPKFRHNDKFFQPLYYETLKANGFWDYAFVDQSSEVRINIKWNKKSKTLSENMEGIK